MVEPLDVSFKDLGFWLLSLRLFVCLYSGLVLSFYLLSLIEIKIACQMHG